MGKREKNVDVFIAEVTHCLYSLGVNRLIKSSVYFHMRNIIQQESAFHSSIRKKGMCKCSLGKIFLNHFEEIGIFQNEEATHKALFSFVNREGIH